MSYRMTEAPGYVSADYLREAAQLVARVKERSYEMMRLKHGARVLDVGCGPGMDTVPLAEQVGPGGRVIGIDKDPAMLADADAHASAGSVAERVEHVLGDATALDFPSDHFDACRAERLLQVLPATVAPAPVVAEMVRVIRPGGWVVLADTDWASASVDFDDVYLERRLLGFFARGLRPNGYAGRQLPGLLVQCGLTEVQVEAMPMVQFRLQDTPFGDWLQREAQAAGVATAEEVEQWRRELVRREAEGRFYACVNMLVAAGRKRGTEA